MYAFEELGNGRLKQHEMIWGIVIIPFIMQPDWFNEFLKVTYIYLFIPAGYIPEWSYNTYKALTIGLFFPSHKTTLGLVSSPVHGYIWKHTINVAPH